MEEKIVETSEEVQEVKEIQTTFNKDSLEELNDSECCTIENCEEVVSNENENK